MPKMAAIKIPGSIFATRIFLSRIRFNPTQKIKTEPVKERYETDFAGRKFPEIAAIAVITP